MKTVKISSVFPASKKYIFKRLQRLKTLQYIAYPYATFSPTNCDSNLIWKSGEQFSFNFKLFGIIPFGIHNISVIKFDIDKGIYTKEGNRFVPTWNHKIILEEIDDIHTKYTDIVYIDAGWKTIFVYLWANCFYHHRQRKWIQLLTKLNSNKKS